MMQLKVAPEVRENSIEEHQIRTLMQKVIKAIGVNRSLPIHTIVGSIEGKNQTEQVTLEITLLRGHKFPTAPDLVRTLTIPTSVPITRYLKDDAFTALKLELDRVRERFLRVGEQELADCETTEVELDIECYLKVKSKVKVKLPVGYDANVRQALRNEDTLGAALIDPVDLPENATPEEQHTYKQKQWANSNNQIRLSIDTVIINDKEVDLHEGCLTMFRKKVREGISKEDIERVMISYNSQIKPIRT
jgi:hypothetical protein